MSQAAVLAGLQADGGVEGDAGAQHGAALAAHGRHQGAADIAAVGGDGGPPELPGNDDLSHGKLLKIDV